MKKNENKDYIYIFSLILLFLIILFSIVGVKYVNGSTVDWDSQHVIFPEYFRNLFYKTKDLFPSFAFNIGSGENIYNFSYYGLLSPMVIISYLFPFIRMLDFVQIYMILMVIISIILMYYWLKKRYDSKYAFIGTLLFLLASPIIYHTHRHIMFINYMPFLILALIGVDNYFDKNKKTMLIISIFLIIMSSYYYSVGSIITIILYGIYKYIEINKKITLKSFIKDGLKFIFPIIIAIMMSAVLILPTFYTLLSGRADITASVNITNLLIPKLNLTEILYGSYTIGVNSIFIIAIIYGYTSKNKNKLLSIIFSLLILFPIIIYLLSGFMYVRGKVLIPFLPLAILLIMNFIDEYKYKMNNKMNIILLIVSILEIYTYVSNKNYNYIYIIDVILIFIAYLLSIKFNNKNYILYIISLSALICCLSNNYTETLVTKEDISLQYNTYNYDILNKILDKDTNIYRTANNIMEMKNLNRVVNTNYYLPSIYSSLENPYYYEFTTKQIGNEMENRISTAISSTNNILFNTYVGSKYMIGNTAPIGYNNVENSNIYINENVLPIGYATTRILDKNTYDSLSYPEKDYALLTNVVIDNNNKVKYKNEVKEENLKYTETHNNITIEKQDEHYIINSEDNGNLVLELNKKYKDKILFITFDMNYSERCGIGDTSITINDVKNTLSCRTWTYHNKNYKFEYSISNIDNKLNIDFTKGKYDISNIKVYSLDYNKILDFVDSVDVFKINKEKTIGDVIEGEINVNSNGYFVLSIPYEEKGFTIYVDNQITNYEKVDNAFIGLPINEGHHDIKIVYTSPYLFEGMVISILGYMIFIPIIYSDIFKKRTK